MGWATGSEVMNRIIRDLPEQVPDDDQRQAVYKVLIKGMEAADWDTEEECLGEDEAFDLALKELYPEWFGKGDD